MTLSNHITSLKFILFTMLQDDYCTVSGVDWPFSILNKKFNLNSIYLFVIGNRFGDGGICPLVGERTSLTLSTRTFLIALDHCLFLIKTLLCLLGYFIERQIGGLQLLHLAHKLILLLL